MAGLLDPNGQLPNYDVTIYPGTLTIAPAPLAVGSDNQSRAYGAPNPALTGSVSGLQNADNISASFWTLAGAASPVGSYSINIGLADPDNKLGNYNVTTNRGVLSVTPVQLIGQADNQSRPYGQPNPPFTVTYSGFVNGDDARIITGLLSGSTPAQTNSPVGVYPIQVSGQAAPNYAISYLPGRLTIGPAPLLVAANDTNRAYGQPNPPFTATFIGLANNDDPATLGQGLVFSTSADTNSPVGIYAIVPGGLIATNYTLTYSNGTLEVRPFVMVVTPDSQRRSYGASNPPLTGTFTGVQNGDNITVTFSTLAAPSSPVGTYPIIAGLSDPDGKLAEYSVTASIGSLTVLLAPLVVSADNQSRAYGAPDPVLTGSVSGLQNGDNISAAFSVLTDSASPVGSYPIQAALSDPDNKLGNYNVTTNRGVLSVTPVQLIGQADDQTRLYGQPNPPLTATYSGFVNSENAGLITGPLSGSTPAQTNSPVGVYPIQVSGQAAPNYTIDYLPGRLTVAPAPLVVQANDAVRAIGQTNPPFTARFIGLLNNEDSSVLGGTLVFSTMADTNSPAGTYPIVPDGLSATNYTLTYSNGTLEVRPFVMVVTPDSQSRSYGASNPVLTGTLTGVQPGDNITATYSAAADANSPVGAYDIVATLNDPNNKLADYSVEIDPATLTVVPAPLVVSADSQSRPYGAPNPSLSGSMRGRVNNDDITVAFVTAARIDSLPGDYPISAIVSDPDNRLANYSVTNIPGTLTISPAPLLVNVDSQSRTYGAPNPALTGSLTGLQNADNIQAVYWTLANTNSPVGTYDILPTITDPNNALGNYSVTTNTGTLTVLPAPLAVSADSQTRTYGASNPVLTGSVTGLQNAENITASFSLQAGPASPVGTYPISIALSDPNGALSNYSVTPNNGTLTIAPAPLLVAADNQSRPYGTPNSLLTGSIRGLVNGDNITASFATLAVITSPAGDYPIHATLYDPGNKLPDYALTSPDGTLTITKAATSASLVSSATLALPHVPIAFTFTLSYAALPPGCAPPGGAVQFLLDGAPYGPPIPLGAGQTSFTTDTLPPGSDIFGAQYLGDANFQGASVALSSPIIIHSPPVATNYLLRRAPDQGTKVRIDTLLAAGNPQGETITFDGASSPTAGGATVLASNGWLFYQPPPSLGLPDSFTYTVHDQYGLQATGTVTVQVNGDTSCRLSIARLGTQTNHISLSGFPWKTYKIQSQEGLTNGNWHWVIYGTADDQGNFGFDDAISMASRLLAYRAFSLLPGGGPGAAVLYVTSSANPVLPGTASTFTATVLADDPGLGDPSGTVQFSIDGAQAGPAVPLAGGNASFTPDPLSAGQHSVTVAYSGDTVFQGATAVLDPPQVVNSPPVAPPFLVYCLPSSGAKVAISDLLTNDWDPEGNPIVFDGVSSASVEGGTISQSGGWLFYTPPANFGGADSFAYTIQDSFGAQSVGSVMLQPLLSAGPAQTATFIDQTNGTCRILFTGIPWRTYTIQSSDDPNGTNWVTLGTATADSWGRFEYDDTLPPGTQPRYYRSLSDLSGPTSSPFRLAVWNNFIANTNGRTMDMWTQRSLPDGWPNVPPLLVWNTNCLLYGMDGFTAISQCNEFEGALGQVPATLITPRHAYVRGHGLPGPGLGTDLAGFRVWFCAADNTVVQMTVLAQLTRQGTLNGVFYDYGLLAFTQDVPPSITPMSALSEAGVETYYANTPDLPYLFFATEALGHCSAQIAPFIYPIMKGGDSGSPNMIPSPDNKLIMISGRSTSAPSLQMQADLDVLSTSLGLNTNLYQLRWYDMRPWGP